MPAASYTGGTYVQDFDNLLAPVVPADNTATIAATVLPTGWTFVESGANANTTLRVHTGAVTTGDTILFGATGSNERALGSFASGSLTSIFGLEIVNSTGSTLTQFTLSYTGEQWRDGRSAAAVQNITAFSYGLGNTAINSGTFTPVTALDLVGPGGTQTGSDVALDGNLPANQTSPSFTITGISWAPGQSLWLRWSDINDAGNDDGLAIDNVSFSAAVTPIAPTVTIVALDNTAAEAGQEPGTFRISRTGATTDALTVSYTVATGAGQATSDDYTPTLTGTVTIPVGASFVDVTITPVDDAAVEGAETVTLNLTDTPDYDLGTDTTATITIADNDVAAVGNIQITEFMYQGANGEFIEFTNVGNAPVDLTGWSFDDDSRTSGSFDLSAFGIVQPGESVILTEATAAAFRATWSLPNSVKVIGGLAGGNNLGRNDEINLYDNNGLLVDRLTYGDQNVPGTIRTQNQSGWAPVNQLADQTIDTDWVLSTVNDAQNSRTSTGNDTGNPGVYNTGTAGVLVIESGGSTNVTEGGATDTYTIVLRSQPTADVTVTINPGSQATTNTTTLTFTAANWNVAQTVTVTAIDDSLVEGNHQGTLVHTVTSSDTNYNGISVTSVTANITDNDFAGIAPTIAEATTTPFLDLPATGTGFASGVVGDPTDPAKTLGIDFTIVDADTPVGDLVVTVSSSNAAVVPNANLTLTGTGATRNLKIEPTGVGLADITVTVSDGANTDSYVIKYAASTASGTPASTRFHTGASDASTAIALDADYMLVADDEDQTIRLYDRNDSGLPLASFDFTSSLGLSGSSEVDIEASTRVGNTIYWLGSHSNNSSGNDRPNRERLFATEVSGTGASSSLTFVGYYQFLEDDLIAWDNANGHGLGAGFLGLAASAADGVLPEQTNGFNIEGLTVSPSGTTAYLAFRAPNQPTTSRTQALIVPVTNFASLLSPTGGVSGSATFGAPIQLDLGGRGIRSIERNGTGEYVIIAGPAGAATGTAPADFRLYTWTGNPADAAVLRNADLTALNAGGSFEAIVQVPDNLTNTTQLQVLVDNGDTIWYNNGVISKDLESPTFSKTIQKFRSDVITLGTPVVTIPEGAISLGTPYTQDFNSLINSSSTTWVNNSINGWYTARTGTGTTIVASNGGATGGALYSFGTGTESDRALGSIGSGNAAAGNFFWGARFFNDTGSLIDTLYINYVGEQWRNSAAAAQTVDFQYQIGASGLTSGTWVNFDPLDFTSPITGGSALALNGNLSQNRTLLSGTLNGLSLAPGQDIWLRWFDPDHTGNDHGLAIDDVQVSTSPLPGITIAESAGNTTVTEGGASDSYTIVLNAQPTADVIVTISNPGTPTQLALTPTTLTFTATNWNIPQIVTVTAVDDSIVEGLHTSTITSTVASADSNYNGLTIAPLTVSIIDNDVVAQITKIHQIQGNAATQLTGGVHNDVSPLNGQSVTIEGVVTADFQLTSQLRGFFIQEETTDQDGDGTTSEGIFVFTGNTPPLDVQEGQKVRVTGFVNEFFGMTQLTATTAGSITLIDGGNNLGLITPAAIALPATGDLDDYYEQFEGMKVQFSDKLVVSEYFELARYGQLVLTKDARPFQYSHIDDTPTAGEYSTFLDSLNRSRIILDDDNNTQNAPLPSGVFPYPQPGGLSIGTQGTNYFRGGDSITGLTGVLHWSFAGQSGTDAWRVRPTQANPISFTVENPRPATPPDVGGNVKVASFNVLNYFTTIDTVGGSNSPRGADSQDELNRQTEKLVQALKGLNADVFGLIELENNGDAANGGAIKAIVDALNAEVGANTYNFINTGKVGTDAITVGFIYKQGVVAPKGNVAVLDTPSFTDPNSTGQQRNRPAIAQTFTVIDPNNDDFGEAFNVVVNHLKSKGSGTGAAADEDQNDGQGASNDTRTKAAQVLAQWLATDPTGQGDADWLIIGDLNAYKGETPITALKNAGYADLVEQFGGPNAYSYVFNGQLGYLDYALANAALAAQITGVAEWHINADEVPVFDYNNTIDDGAGEQGFEAKPTGNPLYEPNAFRTSDHDPVLIGLNLFSTPKVNGQPATIFVNDTNTVVGNAFQAGQRPYAGALFSNTDGTTNPNDVILGTSGNDNIWAGTEGNDLINSGAGDDTIGISAGNSTVNAGADNDFVYTNSATSGTNTIDLGEGNNGAWLAVGNNTVTAGSGVDTIGIGSGNNNLNLGGGNDFVYIIDGYTAGTNTIDVGEGNNSIYLPTGNNTVIAGSGVDTIGIGTGNDVVNAGDGNNVIYSIGFVADEVNEITTGAGQDNIWVEGGTNTINSGDGNDTVGISAGTNIVNTNGGNDFVYTFGSVFGTNTINLGSGANTAYLQGGTNAVTAGDGNNSIGLGAGDDTVVLGNGSNLIYLITEGGNPSASTPNGNDTITTGSGDDQVYLGAGNNTINVGDGNNIVFVAGGTNTVIGGSGNDLFFGGVGNDTFLAGTGNNYLFGDAGSDVFGLVVGGFAQVADFQVGIDKLGLTGGLTAANLTLFQDAANTLVITGGNVIAQLNGIQTTSITAADFQVL